MAQKRKAHESFGTGNGRLSAFAAARLAREQKRPHVHEPIQTDTSVDIPEEIAIETRDIPENGVYDAQDSANCASEPPASFQPQLKHQSTIRLSSIKLSEKNVLRDVARALEVVLSPDDSVTFIGEYDVEVLSGTAEIYGAALQQSSGKHRVYAPSTHALPVIVGRKADTRILVSSVKSSIRKLERLSPLFGNLWASNDKGRSFAYVETTADDVLQRPLAPLEDSIETRRAILHLIVKTETRNAPLRAIILGPKSSGKSTLARQACNALLTRSRYKRCFYLDIDVGQPEFGPPGQVSLVEVHKPVLGPPFTHFASKDSSVYKLIASHTLAATTFKEDPGHYVACIFQLYHDHYLPRVKQGEIPLIINSSGWVTGLGARTMYSIYDLDLTDSVLIDAVDPALQQISKRRCQNCYFLPRRAQRPAIRSPAELRKMQTMAYFHHRAEKSASGEDSIRFTNKPVSDLRPWMVRYSEPEAGIAVILSYSQSLSPEFLSEVLDGSLVAVVSSEDDANLQAAISPMQRNSTRNDQPSSSFMVHRTKEHLPYIANNDSARPLDPRHSQFECLGLVRAIDVESRVLHLLMPLPENQVARLTTKKVVLIRGAFDPPEWAYLEDLYANKGAGQEINRPWVAKREMVGIEGAVWRLRHPPTAAQIGSGK